MSDIPPEAKELIAQFEEEAKKAATKKFTSTDKFSKRESRSRENRQMTAAEVERFARQRGIRVEGGGGRHGKRLIGPDGKILCPLPDHGGGRSLATGTLREILSIINLFSPSTN